MSASTRRGFIGGALAGAAAPALAGSARGAATATIPKAQRPVVRRGRAIAVSPDGRRIVVAHDQRTTIGVGKNVIDVGGQPLAVAVSPDGRIAAVATAFWDEPGVVLVDLVAGRVGARRHAGPAPCAVAFTHDGRHLLVAGGEQAGGLRVLETERWRVRALARPGRVPRSIAPLADGRHAWVSLNADERVALVDLRRGHVTRTVRTPALPDQIALSPDERRLLVSHGHSTDVSEIELRSGRVHHHAAGRHPSGVGWTRNGHRLVALGGDGAVIDVRGRRHHVGPAPRGLAVAGRRFWTVSALTGAVHGGRA